MAYFSRIIEHDKRQGATYQGRQGLLKSIVQAIWSFLWDLRSREPIFSKKKSIVPKKKILAPFFTYYPPWQTSSSFLLGSTRYFGIYCTRYKIISLTPPSLLKTQFFGEKRQTFHRKFFLAFSLVLSNVTNVRKQLIRSLKVFWQLVWKLSDLFCNTWEVVENRIFERKGNLSSEKNYFDVNFLLLSKMQNVREKLIKVHKVVWRVLCELYYHFFRT